MCSICLNLELGLTIEWRVMFAPIFVSAFVQPEVCIMFPAQEPRPPYTASSVGRLSAATNTHSRCRPAVATPSLSWQNQTDSIDVNDRDGDDDTWLASADVFERQRSTNQASGPKQKASAQTLAASLATLHAVATTICRPADPPSQITRASCCNGDDGDAALARLLLPAPLPALPPPRRCLVGRSLGVVKTRRA